MADSFFDLIGRLRIVPVVIADGRQEGAKLAEALATGGLPVAEFTLRMDGALDALKASVETHPEVLAGAGTVVTVDQVDAVVDAGAKFIVSPGLFLPVVKRAQQLGIPVVPGVATASDLMTAVDLGLEVVKLFPASIVGGPPAIAAFSAPFPQMKFIPTGGVNATNLRDYLDLPATLAVGGSWMVDRALVAENAWDEIRRRTAEAVALAGKLS
jgi:2-dehydro-3-deoxyphosphogluconate aldolase / (4S)-4-hydroxy-2-oxoglutarate aldolase